jgi:hypothetical protein
VLESYFASIISEKGRIWISNTYNKKLTIADHIDLFIVVRVAKEADAGGSTAAAATAVIMAAAAGKWRGGHRRFRHSCRPSSLPRPNSSSGHHTPI